MFGTLNRSWIFSHIAISAAILPLLLFEKEQLPITGGRTCTNHIRITCPCALYPLTPNFYIVKLGFTGVYIIYLFLP